MKEMSANCLNSYKTAHSMLLQLRREYPEDSAVVDMLTNALNNLGLCYRLMGDSNSALAYYKQLHALLGQVEPNELRTEFGADSQMELAKLHLKNKDLKPAIQCAEQASQAYEGLAAKYGMDSERRQRLIRAHLLLAQLFREHGDVRWSELRDKAATEIVELKKRPISKQTVQRLESQLAEL